MQLRLQNRADLIFLNLSSIVSASRQPLYPSKSKHVADLVALPAVALIIGSTFYQLPETAAGAFRRGGAIFLGVIFNGFQVRTGRA